jgi:hypothetical protein
MASLKQLLIAVVVGGLLLGLLTGVLQQFVSDLIQWYLINEIPILRFTVIALAAFIIYKLFLKRWENYIMELESCMDTMGKSKTPADQEFYDWYKKGWLTVAHKEYIDVELPICGLGVWFKKVGGTNDVPAEPFVLFAARNIPTKLMESRVMIKDIDFQNAKANYGAKNLKLLNLAVHGLLTPRAEVEWKIANGQLDLDSPEVKQFIGGGQPASLNPQFGNKQA